MICLSPIINAQELSLDLAIEQAVHGDDWLIANEQSEQALREQAIAAGELPDPRMLIGLSNMPVDTFDLRQEPMTQLRIGINQAIPRGDTLDLLQKQTTQQSELNPYLRENRRAAVALEVSNLWLDAYFANQSIALINLDRALFEQLVDITGTRYTSAAGLARQQDLVRAELELVRLDDRLSMLRQIQATNKQKLAEWLPYQSLSLSFPDELPDLVAPDEELFSLSDAADQFALHPRVRAHDQRIEIARTQVNLAKESFKPSFSVGASYGRRNKTALGYDRADFLSLDLSFDLPLFPANRQKPRLRASQYAASARQTERILIIKELFAEYQKSKAQMEVLEERIALFNDFLLAQLADLTEATLNSYTADEGDFEEVMRAYISELNAKIELLQIDIERLKVISKLNYLLTRSKA